MDKQTFLIYNIYIFMYRLLSSIINTTSTFRLFFPIPSRNVALQKRVVLLVHKASLEHSFYTRGQCSRTSRIWFTVSPTKKSYTPTYLTMCINSNVLLSNAIPCSNQFLLFCFFYTR